ncbi:erythrocyte membrane protein 1, PfEMP1, putative [Plasmodium reichenowi]|uniref:Erythrocyte membrane protein 1, PfEMP1, putative n=1 Tax=Plasmodium reichenowi TaxID=5854 RepID=A0A2P9D5K4_PLARE|nr:erythrocyte membrane protein 1, PfEMP1, putative [Plasmodium reichenowi]
MVPQKRPEPDYSSAQDAKELFDMIGQTVRKQVYDAAADYRGELHGHLEKATFEQKPDGKQTPGNPCTLDYRYHTNVTNGRSNPCYGRQAVRFSNTQGAECYWNRIKGNEKNNDAAACYPFRRLHMCDRNLEEIYPDKITNTNNLLVDVCLAALHEGQSIINHYRQLEHGNNTCICTVLARSFADIGDIIRGKDLFLGHNQRKKYLEENLKRIFANIYNDVTSGKKNEKKEALKARYQDDNGGNFFKLREDWWDANRNEVWKAITCEAQDGDKYFRQTACLGGATNEKCRCVTDPPTYFDYVPQYLRWFEEWAEDFCRKKKKYVNVVKTNCGGKDGGEKYCDRDGFDCTQTIRKIFKYARGEDCDNCTVWCGFYEKWIEKQKQEFLKQKKKCEKEIPVNGMQRRDASTENYKGYEKHFHEEIKKEYKDGGVNKFLKLLSNETECKNLKNDEENKVDFTNIDEDKNSNNKGTFYHAKYCQPCPECGVDEGTFRVRTKEDAACKEQKEVYTVPEGTEHTNINVLYSGKGKGDITEKLSEFCKKPEDTNDKKNEQWQCYYKDSSNNKCEMKKGGANDQEHNKIMTFNDFFNFWVGSLLNDSIHWRETIKTCMNKATPNKCIRGCKSKCECFAKWIKKKKDEWGKVKDQFRKQTDIPEDGYYETLEYVLENYYFENIKRAYGELQSIQQMQKMIQENKEKKQEERLKDDVDALDVLFQHELEEADECLKTHKDDVKCDDDEDSPKAREVSNPCSGEVTSGGTVTKYPALVNQIAYQMQADAYAEASKRCISKLRAHADKGYYNGNGKVNTLKNVCEITDKYSNAAKEKSKDPCDGKGKRFKIGEEWKTGNGINISDPHLYLPPRRQHFCTSNLEYLFREKGGRFKEVPDDKASDSLLGDVLLAAKKQAKDIKNKYQENKASSGNNAKNGVNNETTACRAMKYSFADIADIIRGTDLWDQNSGEKTTQENLVKIFKQIKDKLPEEVKGKYANDKDDPKHLELRKDWWEANRDQVWNAMKCAIKKGNITKCNGIPIEDYIPQRLRWMTEWAEWYCKAQKKEYDELMGKCGICMSGTCTGVNAEQTCKDCKNACDDYGKYIKKWEDQWKQMNQKYQRLYEQAQVIAPGTVFDDGKPDYDQVVHFLEELKKQYNEAAKTSGVTTMSPYATAAGYIHQEAGTGDCEEQKHFCRDNQDKYVFREKPKDHDDACGCGKNTKTAKKEEKNKGACEIVGEIINPNHGNKDVGGCKAKDNYPKWTCGDTKLVDDSNVCIPPRRIKMCLYYLKDFNGQTENDLRKEFINNVAAETFLSWHYYKKNNGNDVQLLQNGTIPPQFLRSMYYTYADYRDIFFDKDIFARNAPGDTTTAKDNIKSVFSNDSKSASGKTRQDWWEENAKHIWEGMLCALEKAGGDKDKLTTNYPSPNNKFSGENTPTISVEDFAKRPQFLRWFTEWGDQFCRERGIKIKELEEKCTKVDCKKQDENNQKKKQECAKACKEYQNWLNEWKEQYKKQSEKYFKDKENDQYKIIPEVQSSTHAYDYLNKSLTKLCGNGNCKCMDGESNETIGKTDTSHDAHMPASLDDEPKEVRGKCKCEPPPKNPELSPVKPSSQEEACKIVDEIFNPVGKTYFDEACSTKYKYGKERYTQWKCTNKTRNREKGQEGEVCIPPRRQKLYLKKLEELKDSTTLDQLRKVFIETAAIETFFLWYRYKKIKNKEDIEKQQAQTELFVNTSDVGKNLQEKLEGGEIDDEFKRQMFYTLGDYRDICVGIKDEAVCEALEKSVYKDASDKDESRKLTVQQISEKIEKIIKQSDTTPGKPGEKTSVKTPQETWWENHAEHIWRGMICSLTYKDGTDKPTVDPDVYKKIFGTPGITTPNDGKTGTYNEKYDYHTVKLDAQSSEGQMSTGDAPKLTDFVSRPTYFRWLEEWGDEFCRKQKHKLYIIEKDCRGKDGDKPCSGDGLVCTEKVPEKKEIFNNFNCHSCGKSCRWYKKWIRRKRDEFDKQKEAYSKQKTDAQRNKDGNEFSERLQKYTEAKDFLNNLGPCKKDSGEEGKKGEDEIDFKEPGKTFAHADDCKPCSQFTVDCKNCKSSGDGKKVTCNDGKISAIDIENGGNSAKDLDMRVSDNNTNGFEDNDLQKVCANAGIFKSIKKNKWECGKVCGVDICTLGKDKNGNGKEHITVKEFIKRWLETFFEDYNRINKKLKQCTNSNEGSKCIKGCVNEWIKQKKDEWKNINNTYTELNENKNDVGGNNLSSFLEGVPFKNEVDKAIGPCGTLDNFFKSKKCNGTANSKKSEESTKYDGILCLLDNLGTKMTSCLASTSEDTQQNCGDTPAPVGDDDPLEEEEDPENKVAQPNICPAATQTPPEVESGCDPADKKKVEEDEEQEASDSDGKPGSTSAGGEDSKPEPPQEQPAEPVKTAPTPPPTAPQPQHPKQEKGRPIPKTPPNPFEHPAVIPSLASSTLAWSVGIAFFALSYWWLLKKKSKPPVDLFSVLEIPQNDYSIPTFKSKNRYIPYKSAQYIGKRYIYIEGDSSGDEKYAFMSDTTDVTSSESEYEELDINDIYVPHAPKYKTLIEVVLEPSKRDTQNDIQSDDTPSDIPNTPSDIPPPITDNEWNELKKDFISQYLQSEQNKAPNDYTSGTTPTNTHPTLSRDNVNNNTHPTPSRDTLDQKPFIMSIHDRNLLSGEEYSYDISTNSGNNDLYSGFDPTSGNLGSYSGIDPTNVKKSPYSGTDLMNDALSGGDHDIYDEILKRKENELFGTKHHPKRTNTYSVVKNTYCDPIMNQLDLFHKWLDRHRDMFEKWENHHERLPKLKGLWENETHSGNKTSGNITATSDNTPPNSDIPSDNNIPSGKLSDIHSGNKHSDIPSSNKMLNSDVSIQIEMDNNPVDSNTTNPTQVQIELDVNKKTIKEKYPIGDAWDI